MIKYLIIIGSLLLAAPPQVWSQTQDIRPVAITYLVLSGDSPRPSEIKPKCAFPGLDLPQNAKVHAVGGQDAPRLGFKIVERENEGRLANIIVNSPEEPVLLRLSAYNPTIWQIAWTKETKILAVAALGHHSQFISGLPGDIPAIISSYDQTQPCGTLSINNKSISSIRSVNRFSLKLFGRSPEAIYNFDKPVRTANNFGLRVEGSPPPTNNGPDKGQTAVLIGHPLPPGVTLYTDKEFNPDDFRLPERGPLGLEYLQKALERGWIRKGTLEDEKEWNQARHSREKQQALAEGVPEELITKFVFKPSRISGGADYYYILDPQFAIPEFDSTRPFHIFYVPKGMPMPRILSDTNYSIHFMEDGTYCSSPGSTCAQRK